MLAAGHGTRLRPWTNNCPKPMVPLNGQPMVDFTLSWLARHGVREVAINLHHAPDALRNHVRDGGAYGLTVRYSIEAELLGSAGALVPLRPFFEGESEFAVVYGDVLTDVDLSQVVRYHRSRHPDVTLVVTTAEDPTRCGVVEFDEARRIRRLVEKPPADQVASRWVNAGVYICSSSVLASLPDPCPVPYDFASDLFPRMLAHARDFAAFLTEATVIDVGSVERMALAAEAVRAGRFGAQRVASAC